jgi:signal transduction histidine kinase
LNIIVNDCDAIEGKQVTQSIHRVGNISLSCEFKDGNIQMVITDDGAGMTEKTRLRSFEPFYTTKDVGNGTGLGMAISFAIIEDHGGTITGQSTAGVGSEITVNLPFV